MSDSKPDTSLETIQPEPAPAATVAETPARQSQPAFGAAFWLGLAALAVALALAVAGFFFWDRQHQILDTQAGLNARIDTRLGDVDNVINRVQSGFDQFKAGEEGRRQAADERMDRLEHAQGDQARRLEQLGELISRGNREWSLAEIDYLLTVAGRALRLQRDPGTARAALQAADEALRALDAPAYLPVRERIAAEIAALDAVPPLDRDGLAAGLDALIAQIDGLPLQGHPRQQAATGEVLYGEPEAVPATAPDWTRWEAWKSLPGVVWESIVQLVRVREHDRPLEPMVAPDQEYFLRQNLRLQLEAARLALLREAPAIYRQTLTTARDWISSYFDVNDNAVAAARERVEELASIDIRPALPDIGASLEALREQRAEAAAGSSDGDASPAEGDAGATETAP